MFAVPALPPLDSAFDLATVTLISALIILSVLSLCFIFHLQFKSKSLIHLQGFNSLWTVRFLLVFFNIFWALTELLRLPFFRHQYFSLLNSPTEQDQLCKIHTVLNLGFFEPAFLVTLLFLLNASIRKKTTNDIWAISFVLITCLPIAILQGLLILYKPFENRLPGFFYETSIVLGDGFGSQVVLCAYPMLNSVVFAAFGFAYAVWFVFSCWRVLSLVINKGLRVRIYGLASTVMVALTLQVVFLGLTALYDPAGEAYGVVGLVVFLGAFLCATVGEGILVIKPISDALDACGCCFQRSASDRGWSTGSSEPEKRVEGRDGEENV